MKRSASIEALLKKAGASQADLKRAYEASLHEKKVSEELRVDIKNIFENLRSCLDYMAHDIFEACCPTAKKPDRLYFPIRQTAKEFEQAVARDFPGLEQTHRPVYDILLSFQPFNDPWLGHFNKLNNENKHQDLVEQTRTESKRVTVTGGGGSVSWGPGVTFGGGVRVMGVPIDPRTQLPVPNQQVTTTIVTWVDFQFRDTGLSVLAFMEQSVKKVEELFRALQKHI
ncbi:MAG: hypothetical protein OEV08_08410 [Nitrospira sp.]|nr:hypothetical protein [Nitrospira sp.]